MSIVLYGSVWVAALLYVWARPGNPPPGNGGRGSFLGLPLWWSLGMNTALICLLIYFETELSDTSFPSMPRFQATIQLGIRFFLITFAVLIGRAPFTMYLFYPVLLFAFFTFGRRAAYGVAIGTSLLVMGYISTYSSQNLFSPTDINNLFVFLLGTLMVLLMANALDQERTIGLHLQEAHDELGRSHDQLQVYSAQVATLAATDERNRLARDIHDSLGHHLAATSIQLEKAAAYSEIDRMQSTEALNHARRTIREALGEVRTSVRALRESDAGFDLRPALEELSKRMQHHDLAIHLNISGDYTSFSVFVKMTLYRIIQEGLTNIHKHANATQATIDLCFSPHDVVLKIVDDGQGFKQNRFDDGRSNHIGFGLKGIQERVALVGGQYRMKSELDHGTVVSVTIPQNNEVKEQALVQ